MSVDPVEILHETDRILDEQGWSQGRATGANGESCLGMALSRALEQSLLGLTGRSEAAGTLHCTLTDEIQGIVGEYTSIPRFNDYVAESLEDIKRVTKGARVRLGGEA